MSLRSTLLVATVIALLAGAFSLGTANSVSSEVVQFSVPESMPTYVEYEMWNLDGEMTSGPLVLDRAELASWRRATVTWTGANWEEHIADASTTASVRAGDKRESVDGVARMVQNGEVMYEVVEEENRSVPLPPFGAAFYASLKTRLLSGVVQQLDDAVQCGSSECGRLVEQVELPFNNGDEVPLRSLPWRPGANVQVEEILFDLDTMLVRAHSVILNGATTFRFRLNCYSLVPGATGCTRS